MSTVNEQINIDSLSQRIIGYVHFTALYATFLAGTTILYLTIFPPSLLGKSIKPEGLVPLLNELVSLFQWLIALSIAIASVSFGMYRAMENLPTIQDGIRKCGIYFMRNAMFSLLALINNESMASFFIPSQKPNNAIVIHHNWSFIPVAFFIVWIVINSLLLMNTALSSLSLSRVLWADPFNKYIIGGRV